MASPHNRKQNCLLAAFPEEDQINLFPQMELVPMPLGYLLYEPGNPLQYAYFPTNSIVSLRYVKEGGATAEIAMVSNDGMVGIDLFMGGESVPNQAIVQGAGYAYRIHGQVLNQAFGHAGATQSLLVRYAQALLTQMAQTQGCSCCHTAEQQLCRWLLQRFDYLLQRFAHLPANKLTIPQDMIAAVLDISRDSIPNATANLQAAGLIHNSRGRIQLLNRLGLEARACECYLVIKNEFDRLLPVRKAYSG